MKSKCKPEIAKCKEIQIQDRSQSRVGMWVDGIKMKYCCWRRAGSECTTATITIDVDVDVAFNAVLILLIYPHSSGRKIKISCMTERTGKNSTIYSKCVNYETSPINYMKKICISSFLLHPFPFLSTLLSTPLLPFHPYSVYYHSTVGSLVNLVLTPKLHP